MTKPLKVIVSGGGTGGHIFPAISIANAIKKERPDTEFLFVGAKGKMEMEKVPDAGFKIEGLWIDGIQRKLLSKRNLLFPFKLLSSIMDSRKIIKRFQPDLAVGVGGFASGPLLMVASRKGIPSLIQEQNSYPGITNKLLSKRVDKICVAYDGLERFFPKDKIIFTGNPVRAGIVHATFDKAEALAHFGFNADKKTVFVTGGSLGARGINEGIKILLDYVREQDIQLIWQCGKFYYEEMQQHIKPTDTNIKLMTFVKRMDFAYAAADVIVCRAGAGTITELCIVGRPTILMPSPNVSEDHQTHNAMALVNKNAAKMVKDKEAKELLIPTLDSILNDVEKAQQLSINIKEMAISNAAEVIAKEALALVK